MKHVDMRIGHRDNGLCRLEGLEARNWFGIYGRNSALRKFPNIDRKEIAEGDVHFWAISTNNHEIPMLSVPVTFSSSESLSRTSSRADEFLPRDLRHAIYYGIRPSCMNKARYNDYVLNLFSNISKTNSRGNY